MDIFTYTPLADLTIKLMALIYGFICYITLNRDDPILKIVNSLSGVAFILIITTFIYIKI